MNNKLKYEFFNKNISGPFTIPSGIITTNINIIKRIIKEVPAIGIITTKSIGLVPRDGNREPILTQYAPGCFMNAVGLTNPGVDDFAEELSKLKIPEDKFLLTSIFGANAEDFIKVAKKLAPYSNGLELNLSCPHAKGYGMAIGQNPEFVKEICKAVKNVVDIPVIAKLTPNVPDIGIIAKAAIEGGADGISAINTVGPGFYTVNANPVLTNKVGGMSGLGIIPIGLKCIKRIRDVVDVPIIGCGGIAGVEEVIAYQSAGANIFGIGSALVGLNTIQLSKFFSVLEKQYYKYMLSGKIDNNLERAKDLLKKDIDMSFTEYTLVENQKNADDFSVLIFDKKINILPGQFIFAWIPEVGEKPFSVLDDNPLKLGIRAVGCFSKKLISLEKGAKVFFRGPYGVPIKIPENKKIITVSGGCGFAANYLIAKQCKDSENFVGAKDKAHLFYIEEASKFCKLHIATDDGSQGYKGFVTEILRKRLEELKEKARDILFYNYGPPIMIKLVTKIQLEYTKPENIFNSIDYPTRCGVGICGSCGTKDGKRLCVDGPFIEEAKIQTQETIKKEIEKQEKEKEVLK